MRFSPWLIVLQWLSTLCVAWSSLVLFSASKLALIHYANALGGKPLPALTQWTGSFWWYLHPLPFLLITLYATFSPAPKKDVVLFASITALALSLAAICTIALGTILPAIPHWPAPMTFR